jgi:hypothetical protein
VHQRARRPREVAVGTKLRRRILGLALLLSSGFATGEILSFVQDRARPGSAWSVLVDCAGIPGAIVGMLFYPAGPHTGLGTPPWAVIVYVTNLLVYAGFWWGVALGIHRILGRVFRKENPRSG